MRRKVLIIEDEPEIRAILAIALRHAGEFDAITAADGLEGLEVAEREKPDVILLDALMPGLDGYGTCRRIRQHPDLQSVPVVFLTAKTDYKAVAAAVASGASACLAKPFDPLLLSSELESILDDALKTGDE